MFNKSVGTPSIIAETNDLSHWGFCPACALEGGFCPGTFCLGYYIQGDFIRFPERPMWL